MHAKFKIVAAIVLTLSQGNQDLIAARKLLTEGISEHTLLKPSLDRVLGIVRGMCNPSLEQICDASLWNEVVNASYESNCIHIINAIELRTMDTMQGIIRTKEHCINLSRKQLANQADMSCLLQQLQDKLWLLIGMPEHYDYICSIMSELIVELPQKPELACIYLVKNYALLAMNGNLLGSCIARIANLHRFIPQVDGSDGMITAAYVLQRYGQETSQIIAYMHKMSRKHGDQKKWSHISSAITMLLDSIERNLPLDCLRAQRVTTLSKEVHAMADANVQHEDDNPTKRHRAY